MDDKIILSKSKSGDFYINTKSFDVSTTKLNPFILKFFFLNDEVKITIGRILDKISIYLGILSIRDTTYTVLKEMIINSVKANSKRIFFKEREADIQNNQDYEKNISEFKKDFLENQEKYNTLLKKYDYYVLILFRFNKEMFQIKVKNNVSITDEELKRINQRIEKSKQYSDMSEIFMDQADETEGAGLGLSMSLLMLKNEGISPDNYTIIHSEKDTTTTINIPLKFHKKNPSFQKTQDIISNLDTLPTFPKTITKIQELISDSNANLEKISALVESDVSLAANILKIANSAAFAQQNHAQSIERAIQLIGFRELSNILFSVGTKRIMEDKYPAFEEIWKNANKSAFICKLLANRMGFKNNFTTNLISASLLHDIGMVVILSLEPELTNQIKKIIGEREIPALLSMEEISIGTTHTIIGLMIAEKWNFPETLKIAVQYHHTPLMVNEKYHSLIFPVYLANKIIDIINLESQYSYIHTQVLEYFDFTDEKIFMKFVNQIKKEYAQEMF
ncbi:MAG: HDOD domain-containing protein [Leptospiraceae bacterium]|nr:HDOD domain-containing protein [Leptospiraceae bacterium]MCP5497580.1 HDOD domain-containing protein [Leptospiraceae bacterium]